MDKKLLIVPVDKILELMPYIDKYVKPAYDTGIGEQKWETIIARALFGDLLIWLAFADGKIVGAASTEVIKFDGYSCVHLITTSSDNGAGFEDWHPFLYDYAKQIGAEKIQFWGRKGWSRAIDKVTGSDGEKYREVYRVFSMEINNENRSNSEPSCSDSAVGCSTS